MRIGVFCGSNDGATPVYCDVARELGVAMAKRGIGLVYGGASVGMMGAVADAALAAGGEVFGVIPGALVEREIAHSGLTELHVVVSLNERKLKMFELSDAFIALPGGFGTLDELLEVVTLSQIGVWTKPAGLLDVRGFYSRLVAHFDHAVKEGLLRPEHRAMLQVSDSIPDLLALLVPGRAPAR